MELNPLTWPAAAWTATVVVSYLTLYTAYDKETHKLSPALLWKMLSFKSVGFTLKEWNKVSDQTSYDR
jgi:hypothetical protein